MPRTRRHLDWTVIVNEETVNVRSKTYLGACYKAFKKLNVEPPKLTTKNVGFPMNSTNLIGIKYDYSFPEVYAFSA